MRNSYVCTLLVFIFDTDYAQINSVQMQMQRYSIMKRRNLKWANSHTDKKEIQIFLIYKEIQSGAVAKSYVRKGFLLYEERRKYFPIYEEAVSHIWLCNCSILNFLIYEENLIFFFISAENTEVSFGFVQPHLQSAYTVGYVG